MASTYPRVAGSETFREVTPTRERLSINGLWRWQPAGADVGEVPRAEWGYAKVPGPWPGVQDYLQSDYQTLYAHAAWKEAKLGDIRSAWYERTIQVPAGWTGRRIAVDLEYLNSFAAVYLDGKEVGQVRYPAGQVSHALPPGFPGGGHAPLAGERQERAGEEEEGEK